MKKITAIIINFNTPETTLKAINELRRHARDFAFDLILIDNNSAKKIALTELKDFKFQYIQNHENLGFAKAVNQGIRMAQSEYVLLLNSDCFVQEHSLESMLNFLSINLDTAVLGPKIRYPDGQTQPSFGYLPTVRRLIFKIFQIGKIWPLGTLVHRNALTEKYFRTARETEWVSGACMLVRKNVFAEVGLFDEAYFFGFEDIDFCCRIRQAGYKVVFLPTAKVIHYHGFSSGGKRSLFSLQNEANGMRYFYKKNWPEKKIGLIVVNLLYAFKLSYTRIWQSIIK